MRCFPPLVCLLQELAGTEKVRVEIIIIKIMSIFASIFPVEAGETI